MSVNKVILVGHVGKDPDIRYIEKNLAVANFTLATSERAYTLQNGTQVPERTEWHNIVAWRSLATTAEKFIRKGSQLYIEGKIQTRNWEKDGIKRYTTEIIAESIQLLGAKRDSNEAYGSEGSMMSEAKAAEGQSSVEPNNEEESGLPF